MHSYVTVCSVITVVFKNYYNTGILLILCSVVSVFLMEDSFFHFLWQSWNTRSKLSLTFSMINCLYFTSSTLYGDDCIYINLSVTLPAMRNMAALVHTRFCLILRSEVTIFWNIYNECHFGRMYRGETVWWGQSFVGTEFQVMKFIEKWE